VNDLTAEAWQIDQEVAWVSVAATAAVFTNSAEVATTLIA
jgi:hypothetical protein